MMKKCRTRELVVAFICAGGIYVLLSPFSGHRLDKRLFVEHTGGNGFAQGNSGHLQNNDSIGKGQNLNGGNGNNYMQVDNNRVEEVIKQRRQHVEEICTRIGKVTSAVKEVSGVPTSNMSYCAVQKAGCTNWIRLFKFLHGQNRDTDDPMSLTKYQVHNEHNEHYKKFNFESDLDRKFIENSIRATTVRDPYTRLWSAFIDKFLLPDFWQSKGKHVISMTRNKPDAKSLRCGHDVKFAEFIQYVINVGHQFKYWNQDKHWLPASDICDPCMFKPDIIGKQETFIADFDYTLKKVGLEKWADKFKEVDHTEYEINEEVDYTFRVYKRVESCVDKLQIARRLWTAFVLNGYVPANETFPSQMDKTQINADTFLTVLRGVREKYNMDREQMKAIRKHAITTAYKLISKENMEKLKDLYKTDFEMFQYDSDPAYLH